MKVFLSEGTLTCHDRSIASPSEPLELWEIAEFAEELAGSLPDRQLPVTESNDCAIVAVQHPRHLGWSSTRKENRHIHTDKVNVAVPYRKKQ